MGTHTASSLSEFLDALFGIVEGFGDVYLWWRGQAVESWKLVPSIHRGDTSTNEKNTANLFRVSAPALHPNCPEYPDLAGWLFLMQHYRLPTRLLDWSQSPLVALFFAVEDRQYDEQNSAIWALHPGQLNCQTCGEASILMTSHSKIKNLYFEAFNDSDNPTEQILAIFPRHTDLRHVFQQAVATIHGTNKPIDDLEGAGTFIEKIVIPGSAKKRMRERLRILGITRSTLFPDLENLALDLKQMDFNKPF